MTTNPTPSLRTNNGFWILLATILGSSMAFIDSSVVIVALPMLQTDLNASATQVQWVVEAYALFLGALILVGGSLGDQFGRKRVFAIGIALFAVASIWCGVAPNITQLIAARAVQGVGGALLTPGSLAIIRASFDSERRGQAIGLWSGFSAITSVLGPLLGGWLVQTASWRWIFFINIPLAVIVLIVVFLRVPESGNESERNRKRLDWPGALLTVLGLGGIVYGLIESGNLGLGDPLVLICICGGLAIMVVFVLVEQRSAGAMMPLILFRSRTFSGVNLLTFLLYASLGGVTYFVTFNLIRVQGYTPTAAGAAFVPLTLLLFILSRWSGGLVRRYGARLPLVVGPLIAAVGLALFALPDIGGSFWLTFFPAVMVLGLGMAITVAPLTTAVLGAVDEQYAGIASGVNNAVARVAALLAIAIFGIIVLLVFNVSLDHHLADLHLAPALQHVVDIQRGKIVGIELPASVTGQVRVSLQQAINEAFVSGFRVIMLVASGLALGGALCAFLLVSGNKKVLREQNELHEDHVTGSLSRTR